MERLLNNAAGLVGGISSAAIAASITYDLAYFSPTNIELLRIATLADYLSNAIIWLPASALICALIYIAALTLDTILSLPLVSRFIDGEPAGQHSSNIQATVYLRPRTILLFFVFLLFMLCILAMIWKGTFLSFIILTTFLVAMACIASTLPIIASRYGIGRTPLFVLYFSAIFTGLIAFSGYLNGVRDTSVSEGDSRIVTMVFMDGSKTSMRILRVYDRGVLFRSPRASVIRFIRWDEIRSFSAPTSIHRYRPVLCAVPGLARVLPQRCTVAGKH